MNNYNINYKEIVKKFDIKDLKLRNEIIIVNNEHIFEYSDKRIAKAVFEKLKNFLFIINLNYPYKTLQNALQAFEKVVKGVSKG